MGLYFIYIVQETMPATPFILPPPSQAATMAFLFAPATLTATFVEHFASSKGKGVDRLNGPQFGISAASDLQTASAKLHHGKFRFSPYLELLRDKGRTRAPRLISIPTIRDRVILHQLNRFLATVFPECVPRDLASAAIRELTVSLNNADANQTFVCGCDIKSFYDNIDRQRLIGILSQRIVCSSAIHLVSHALSTPTVPKSAKRFQYGRYKTARGVPQGLAISNILAAIYMSDVDRGMRGLNIGYHRYVDDVLMHGDETNVRAAHRSLSARLRHRGLSLHPIGSGKGHLGALGVGFEYLGYSFSWPAITVRQSTLERLLNSLAAKFSHFRHTRQSTLQKFPGLTEGQLRQAFVLEVNERITGLISRNRKYGWLAYFGQITDQTLLHRLDSTVASLFLRLPDFTAPPADLKKFARAFFEMKYRPLGGYIENYDAIVTPAQQRAFLVLRGRLAANESITDAGIQLRFEAYRQQILRSTQADEGESY